MSGRGRGRGRGAPPSGAKLLLMRSAQESGLGDHNLKALTDITKPALFPELVWNYNPSAEENPNSTTTGTTKASLASTVYLINKGRELEHRIQTSSFWIRRSQKQVDVVRYQSKEKRHRVAQMPSDQALIEQIGTNLTTDDSYTPQELVPNTKRQRTFDGYASDDDGADPKSSLDELEKQEVLKKREEARKANELEEEGEKEFSDGPPPDESEEEGEDYVTNYYESENESEGGDDAEATF